MRDSRARVFGWELLLAEAWTRLGYKHAEAWEADAAYLVQQLALHQH